MRRWVIRSFFIGLLLLCVGGCHSIGHADEIVTLTGVVHAEKYFGPPNYGENVETDQVETAYVLQLNKPLTYHSSDGRSIVTSEVQMIGFTRAAEHDHVTLSGTLEEAVSGHHRRDVLLVNGSKAE